jgi:hypothetical protein
MLCADPSPAETAKESLQTLRLKTDGTTCALNRDLDDLTFAEQVTALPLSCDTGCRHRLQPGTQN